MLARNKNYKTVKIIHLHRRGCHHLHASRSVGQSCQQRKLRKTADRFVASSMYQVSKAYFATVQLHKP